MDTLFSFHMLVDVGYLRDRLFSLIDFWFSHNGRNIRLREMYNAFGEQLLEAPASSKVHYHNAFPGGYLDHVLRVFDLAFEQYDLFQSYGGVPGFERGELAFAALHHDLGKLGEPGKPQYTKEQDPFWIKKGFMYKHNDHGQVMSTYDRTLFLLNKYQVNVSKSEMIGIRMADGVFDPANDFYFKAKGEFPHSSYIGYIVHWADWMASKVEESKMAVASGKK